MERNIYQMSSSYSATLSLGKIHWKNTAEQLKLVGPSSLGVALLTAAFVGMVFTIQAGPVQSKATLDESMQSMTR
jgi:ABC-type transporter Mla maintaining outer membrane lipid asymmetry permease subunit MlaE